MLWKNVISYRHHIENSHKSGHISAYLIEQMYIYNILYFHSGGCLIMVYLYESNIQESFSISRSSSEALVTLLWYSDVMWWQIWDIVIGWDNGLVPSGTKSLPEPMLTYNQWILWHWHELRLMLTNKHWVLWHWHELRLMLTSQTGSVTLTWAKAFVD